MVIHNKYWKYINSINMQLVKTINYIYRMEIKDYNNDIIVIIINKQLNTIFHDNLTAKELIYWCNFLIIQQFKVQQHLKRYSNKQNGHLAEMYKSIMIMNQVLVKFGPLK